jgi:protein-L-isoaspartate(D-aspartate) O-methyltransferase
MGFSDERRSLAGSLVDEGLLKSDQVMRAFMNVKREMFVWPGTEEQAYLDMPLPLGNTGQTISAPSMVVIMLEALKAEPGDVILEVGTGSGYNAALLAELAAPSGEKQGRVVSLERIPELFDYARKNLARAGYSGRVEVLLRDGTLGDSTGTEGFYDGIVVTAAAPRIPLALKKQLSVGGVLLIPLGPLGYQNLIRLVRASADRFVEEDLGGCVFVPLVGKDSY